MKKEEGPDTQKDKNKLIKRLKSQLEIMNYKKSRSPTSSNKHNKQLKGRKTSNSIEFTLTTQVTTQT